MTTRARYQCFRLIRLFNPKMTAARAFDYLYHLELTGKLQLAFGPTID